MQLIPNVKSIIILKGEYQFHQPVCVDLPQDLFMINEVLNESFFEINIIDSIHDICFLFNSSLDQDTYHLDVNASGVKIEYSSYSGALYGIYTMIQMINDHKINYCKITDNPDLKIRGYMLDISRDKIPNIDEIKKLIRQISILKLNHLELYIEGFSFGYESFTNLPFDTPLTKSEYIELEKYAKIYAVDLVPNMNGFGHMTKWLALDKYKHLAEKEDGFVQWGFPFPPSTLNPLDENSYLLVKKMYEEILPISTSPYFHMNFDEPFELGQGKSKETCETFGKAKVYMDFANKIKDVISPYHKNVLIWGDVLINHPEILTDFPKSFTICDWGYDYDYPFESHATTLEKEQIPFILSPGTSSWNSFSSRKKDMTTTTKNACESAKKHHGLGIITTDWGDFGHIQYSIFSLLGLAYAGCMSWSSEIDDVSFYQFIDKYLLKGQTLSKDIDLLSSYSSLENHYVYNGSMAFQTLMFVDPSVNTPIEIKALIWKNSIPSAKYSSESLSSILSLLSKVELKYSLVNSLEKREILNTVKLIKLCVLVRHKVNENIEISEEDIRLITEIISEHEFCWLQRNEIGGLDRSLSRLIYLKQILKYLLPPNVI